MIQQTDKEVIIVIAQRDLRIPIKCPECGTWTKNPISTIKTRCHKCDKDFEKSPFADNPDIIECLRDATFLAFRLFMAQNQVKVQYGDLHKNKAEQFIEMFKKSFGLKATEPQIKNIIIESTKKLQKINEVIIYKPEEMIYYMEK